MAEIDRYLLTYLLTYLTVNKTADKVLCFDTHFTKIGS